MTLLRLFKINIWSLCLTLVLGGCAKENQEYIFVHDSNLITQMITKSSHTSGEFRGQIFEFDKQGERIEGELSQEELEGGYGLILFPISASLQNDVDLTNMYLKATLTYDQKIDPSLSGRHDISGDGMLIMVVSGEGTKRQYRVRAYFE